MFCTEAVLDSSTALNDFVNKLAFFSAHRVTGNLSL